MKKKFISTDEKLCFALDYIQVEPKYKKSKTKCKIANISTLVLAGICAGLALVGNYVFSFALGVFGSMIMFPSIYWFHSKKKEVIDNANRTRISYRQFLKMERSGELKKLIAEAKKLMTEPTYVGIEKITPNRTNSPSTPTASKSQTSSKFQYIDRGR